MGPQTLYCQVMVDVQIFTDLARDSLRGQSSVNAVSFMPHYATLNFHTRCNKILHILNYTSIRLSDSRHYSEYYPYSNIPLQLWLKYYVASKLRLYKSRGVTVSKAAEEASGVKTWR